MEFERYFPGLTEIAELNKHNLSVTDLGDPEKKQQILEILNKPHPEPFVSAPMGEISDKELSKKMKAMSQAKRF